VPTKKASERLQKKAAVRAPAKKAAVLL